MTQLSPNIKRLEKPTILTKDQVTRILVATENNRASRASVTQVELTAWVWDKFKLR